MVAADGERWDARYSDGKPEQPVEARLPIALGHADEAVLADFPTSGAALDVASGLGAQTLWLADRGLHVQALDISRNAMASLLVSASAAGLANRVAGGTCDFDDGIPSDFGSFDVIVCQRFRAPHLYEAFIERLRPGGWLVMTILSETGATDPGEFHAPPGELTLFFDRPGCTLVAHHEGDGQESIVIKRSLNT